MMVLRLLILSAPLAQGIAFNSEAWGASLKADGRSSTLSPDALDFFRDLENASSKKPVLMPPGDVRRALQESRRVAGSSKRLAFVDSLENGAGEFQASEEFQRAA